jgi:hypothetical protein
MERINPINKAVPEIVTGKGMECRVNGLRRLNQFNRREVVPQLKKYPTHTCSNVLKMINARMLPV